jgi:hypothetical protein
MECRQGKTNYSTEGEARAAIRGMQRDGRGCNDLRVYACPYGDHFHLTKQASINAAHERPKVKARVAPIPSAAKLRRVLADRGALIACQQRRLDAAEAAQKKAEVAYRRAVDAASEERAAIAAMTDRLIWEK